MVIKNCTYFSGFIHIYVRVYDSFSFFKFPLLCTFYFWDQALSSVFCGPYFIFLSLIILYLFRFLCACVCGTEIRQRIRSTFIFSAFCYLFPVFFLCSFALFILLTEAKVRHSLFPALTSCFRLIFFFFRISLSINFLLVRNRKIMYFLFSSPLKHVPGVTFSVAYFSFSFIVLHFFFLILLFNFPFARSGTINFISF